MENVGYLGGVAPGQLKEKGVGGMTGGIRASSQMVNSLLDDERSEQVCMKGQVMEKSWMNSLGFVDLMVRGKTIPALVDTGATHNFMMTWLAREVGLMILPSNMEVKAVNSRAKVASLAHEVPVQIKDWTSQLDFTVMEMNDFDIILGQDLLKGNRAIVVPFYDEVVMVGRYKIGLFPVIGKGGKLRCSMFLH